MKNVSSENKALEILDILKNRFEGKIINELEMDNVYTLELATLFNKMDLKKIKELFNNDYLIKILDEHKNREKDNYRKIWTVYTFIKWYQVFFEG